MRLNEFGGSDSIYKNEAVKFDPHNIDFLTKIIISKEIRVTNSISYRPVQFTETSVSLIDFHLFIPSSTAETKRMKLSFEIHFELELRKRSSVWISERKRIHAKKIVAQLVIPSLRPVTITARLLANIALVWFFHFPDEINILILIDAITAI